jgi:dTDP-4-amino-4,6-dideoxygalactose transaminase
LPDVAQLSSYLQRIDSARSYTNWGPLACELEQRLARFLGVPDGAVTLCSSGTTAIVGALLAVGGRAATNRRAVVPAFTFVATALAAEQCGFTPNIIDVHPDTWSLNSDDIDRDLSRLDVVIPVAPFGRAVPQAQWAEFQRRSGVPVVIDGGASFEALTDDPGGLVGPVPVALSFHATKSFSTAEGGAVVTTDLELSRRVGQALNFGFGGARECMGASTNGKASEYHAAIGLAELDAWPAKRAALLRVAATYRLEFDKVHLDSRLITAPDVASCYVIFRCENVAEAESIVLCMTAELIESRFWYGRGLHRQAYFSSRVHKTCFVTDDLAPRLIALPVAPDLRPDEIARVVGSVVAGVRSQRDRKSLP